MSSHDTSSDGAGDGAGGLHQTYESAKSTLKSVATKVQNSEVMGDVTEQAESLADIGRQRAAEYVRAVGGVLAQSADSLKQCGLAGMDDGAGLLQRASSEVERLATTLNSRGPKELLSEAETFARNHPMWFLAAAFGAGVGIARALKTATPDVTRNADGGVADRNDGTASFDQDRSEAAHAQ